ncbi:glycosyltransferase family 4 protein [Aeromonas simiae]|uniref:glycosyltransferase family 4 protein n=1 Tax=Aeromonas simiae TaxID=218936 RepID=UPI00266B8B88|nr:glycosyltransferase family 4 protein [Aeromonas simiae]MDO2947927.1 glycosyltransferase family 4 protein [Aeromonas simiae]MDO2955310.1 glycosyltransferase family 4 protein [Aeromonas simiae]
MKKIVISSNTSWSVFNFRLDLINHLIAKGYLIEIISPNDLYSDKLRELGFIVHDIKMASSNISPFTDLVSIFNYAFLLIRIKPDYYLGFTAKPNIYGGYIAALLGSRVVNNIAGLGRTFSNKGVLQSVMQFMYRIGLSKSHHVFFQNKDDLALFERNDLLGKGTRSILPGSGVNTHRFNPKNPQHHTSSLTSTDVNGSLKAKFTFLFSARLLLEKGIREYIHAAREVCREFQCIEFQVLGKHTGSAAEIPMDELEKACSEGVIKYLGTTDDVVSVLHGVDCFVLPSYYREGVPRSLLEAGSCGLPLITTDSVGCCETVIDGVNGFLVMPQNYVSLTDAIKKMISLSHDDVRLMGEASRKYMINNFSEDLVFEKYEQVLQGE